MLRAIASVIVGYLVVIVAMFVMFSCLWFALGVDGSYEPGTWVLSQNWRIASIVIELIAGVCAGWTCAAIAKTSTPPRVLAFLFLVFGVINALMMMSAGMPDLGARPDTVGLFEAMSKHAEPIWNGWLHPLLGFAGVWIGAKLKRKA